MWSVVIASAVAVVEPPVDAFLDADITHTRSIDDDGRAHAVSTRVFVSQWETRTGVPTTVWLPAPTPGTRSPRAQGLTAAEVSRRVLFDLAPLYRAEPLQLARAHLEAVHDLGEGAVVVSFSRRIDGVPVFRERITVVLSHELEPVAALGALSAHAVPALRFSLTAQTALELSGQSSRAAQVRTVTDGWTLHAGHAASRKVLYATPTALVPAWHLVLDDATVVISAHDGQLLSRQPRAADATFRVWAKSSAPFTPLESPEGDTGPHPTGLPDGWAPAMLTPAVLVTLEHAGLATMDPWLPPNATALSGNNAIAYADLFAPTGRNDPMAGLPRLPDGGTEPGTPLPDGGTTRGLADPFPRPAGSTFDFAWNALEAPTATDAQSLSAATHAFFVTNWLHDVFYDLGFTEQAGNAQADNRGRGGLANDPLLIEVNDFSGLARESRLVAAPDGLSPRLELFAVTAPGRATVSFTPALAVDAGLAAAPMRPGAWSVTAPVVRVASGDGGFDVCGPWTNHGALAGAIAFARASGPCGTVAALDDLAADAGAVGLLLVNGLDTREPGITVPTHVLDDARAQALTAALDAGVVTATLERTLAVGRPAALDSTLIAHEFGHLLANRLTNDGLVSSQGRAIAEGTGDVVAVLALLDAADAQRPGNTDWRGAFTIGAFAAAQTTYDGASTNAHLFGVRRYPLSSDLARNPLTLRHIVSNVPLPSLVPTSLSGGAGPDNATPHNAGEVWAAAVWDVTTRLLRTQPFEQARRRALTLLVSALKAMPAAPTMLEGRDAFLAVSRATGVTEFGHALDGFAARGLGLSALVLNRRSSTNAPVAEDFSTSGARWALLEARAFDDTDSCDNDGVLDRGETGRVELTLLNVGARALTASRLTLDSEDTVLVLGEKQVTATAEPFAIVKVSVPAAAQDQLPGVAQSRVFVTSPDGFIDSMMPVTRFVRLNTDFAAAARETFDTDLSTWQLGREGVAWEYLFRPVTTQNRLLAGSLVGAGAPTAGLTWANTPVLRVGTGPLSFTFQQAYSFESNGTRGFDGAQLRLSVDDGPFTLIPDSAISRTIGGATIPGYDGLLLPDGANPLAGQPGFYGAGAQQQVTVSLGTQYANRAVRVQFVLGTDEGGVSTGWSIDDVEFTGLAMPAFTGVLAHRNQCVNKPPAMEVAVPQFVDERIRATLRAPVATDPNGDVVTFSWEQTSGPAITLMGDQFDAPEVRRDTQLQLRVTASDGRGGTASQSVTVTVRNVNRTPTSTAGASLTVTSGQTVTLDGAAQDPDGDTLVVRWTQLGGPEVKFSALDDVKATFVAPDVTTASEVNLELNVSDGSAAAAPARVTIVVQPRGCGCTSSSAPLSLVLLGALLVMRRRRARPSFARW